MKNFYFVLTFFFLSLAYPLRAQDFVYEPVNPAFGGETFNYQMLLSGAQAQNKIEEDDPFSTNTLQNFEENLNRQILSQLSRRLVTAQFGEEGLEDGTFILGDFQIDINTTGEGVNIDVLDQATGDQTNILIPYF